MFDAVYFINLDSRPDRLHEICGELDKMDISGIRFPAIHHKSGIVGCGYSHLAVLKLARDRNLKNVLILEDDFEFIVSKDDFYSILNDFFNSGIPYDVLMLSYNIIEAKVYSTNTSIQRVINAQTASGYIVNETMYDRLIALYETNIPLLEQSKKHWIYANDQIWKQLQGSNSEWFATTVRIGKQRASYSDNAQSFQDYGV